MDAKQVGLIVLALVLMLVAGVWLPVLIGWMADVLSAG